jgi:tRNA dimethylallyltransferase
MIPLVVITGPTATGKSEAAVMLAKLTGGEVVSADSMQVYRYMDIGTAKPTVKERQGVPHHMIDVVDPDQEYSVALFQKQARRAIAEIHKKGNLPILIGGTGLYIRAVTEHYNFTGIKGDPGFRQKLQQEAAVKGPAHLYQRLSAVDPEAAGKLHCNDTRRIIRALEVFHHTGQPISSFYNRSSSPIYKLAMFGLILERNLLYQRIEQRVDEMIAKGLVEEVRGLLGKSYGSELTSMQGLGYKEIVSYLTGEINYDQAVYLLKRNTRRFAKRQLTWFRNDRRLKWLDVSGKGGIAVAVKEIMGGLEGINQNL